MRNSKSNQKTGHQNVYEQVTARIIDKLEQGVCPWQSPYLGSIGYPVNFATQKPYRGVNVFLLGSLGFASPFFLTFRQAAELGGYVRTGERGNLVIKFGTFETEDGEAGEEENRRFLKTYHVFNACQLEGISFPLPETKIHTNPCEKAEAIISGMPNSPAIKFGTAQAFYRPLEDTVYMPGLTGFTTAEAHYSTLFHELGHSTGHASRLARKSLMDNHGPHRNRKIYAEEELVAEMTAAFLNAEAGILENEIENSAAYIAGWAVALKEDKKISVVRAASQAQKATDFILRLNHTFPTI